MNCKYTFIYTVQTAELHYICERLFILYNYMIKK